MKILFIYCKEFTYTPTIKTLDSFPDIEHGETFNDSLVAYIQAEEHDIENQKGTLDKLVKNLKWAAKKNETKKVVLHSFAHLSESKANPHFTKEIFDLAEAKMKNAEYECTQTPFGYFLNLKVDAPGYSQARMFKGF